MTQIAITRLGSNSTYETEYFLGAASLSEVDLLEVDRSKILGENWSDGQKQFQDQSILDNLSLRVFRKFELNDKYGLPDKSKRILVGPFLDYFVPVMFDRFKSLFIAHSIVKNPILTLYPLSRRWVPKDLLDFNKGIESDIGNEQLFQDIISLCFPHTSKQYVIDKELTLNSHIKLRSKSLSNILIKTYNFLVRRRSAGVIASPHIGLKEIIKLIIRLKFRVSLFPSNYDLPREVSESYNKVNVKGSKIHTDGELIDVLEKLCLRLLPYYLPFLYSRANVLNTWIQREFLLPAMPKYIFTANAYNFNEAFKAYAAFSCAGISKLVIAQHGGHYGIGAFNWTERHERAVSDCYLTWGWNDNQYPTKSLIPLGIIKPSLGLAIKCEVRYSILIIGLTVPRWPYRYYSTPMGIGFIDHIKHIKLFIENLSHDMLPVCYRPAPNSRSWDQKILFDDIKESLNFSTSGASYAKDVQSASLIICVNNGTTFIECLSESKPAILVLNERQWLFREQADDIISELLGVGLMHFDAKGAAQFCNEIDLVSWWQRDDVALVRSNFLYRFGRKLDSVSVNLSNILSEL